MIGPMGAGDGAAGRSLGLALAGVVATFAAVLAMWWWLVPTQAPATPLEAAARAAGEPRRAPSSSSSGPGADAPRRAFPPDGAAPAPRRERPADDPDGGSPPDGDAAPVLPAMQRFAAERATFVTEVNAMLGRPPPRRFEGTEPTLGWRRDFGHGLRQQSATLRACFERSEARAGAAGGLIEYELSVDDAGRVVDAAITADPVGDADLSACLLEALRHLTVPASTVGTLSYRGAVLVGGEGYLGPRPPRAASQPGDGLTFVHVVRGLGPLPE